MPTTIKRAKGSVNQEVWVGDVAALKQLVRHFEELADYVREKLFAADREDEAGRREKFLEDYSFMKDEAAREERWQEQTTKRRSAIDAATQVQMNIEQGRWSMSLSGDPEIVLSEVDDVDDVKQVQIKLAGSPRFDLKGYDVFLSLGETSASASFEAPESHFIDLAGRRLEDQLRQQRPWYWWFRASWAIGVFAIMAGISSYFVSVSLLRAGAELWAAIGGQLLVNLSLLLGCVYFARQIAIPFELVPDGDKGSGRRNLGRIAKVTVWFIAAIAIPLLLNLLPRS